MKSLFRSTLVILSCLLGGVLLTEWVESQYEGPPEVALCPNYHIIQHHPTPWEAERGRRIRFDSLPPCP